MLLRRVARFGHPLLASSRAGSQHVHCGAGISSSAGCEAATPPTATHVFDYVVAGGSVIGSSIAYFLKTMEPLAKIAVVERDSTYSMASAPLSAGGLRVQFSNKENVLISQFGADFLRNIATTLRTDADEEDCLPDVHFVENGYLFLATEDGQQALRDNVALQQECGSSVDLLSKDQLADKFPWLDVSTIAAGGYGTRGEGWFDPHTLLRALRRKAQSLGVQYLDGEVVGVDTDGGEPATVTSVQMAVGSDKTEVERLPCGAVVNATGPWCTLLANAAGVTDLPVAPRTRTIFSFHCKDAEAWSDDVGLVVDPTTGAYFRPEGLGGCGKFICGVSPPASDDPDIPVTFQPEPATPQHHLWMDIIWPALAQLVPDFETVKLTHTWAGYYAYNKHDQNALLGLHPAVKNMYFANGFSGHGLQQAPAVGRAIAELALTGSYQSLDLSRLSVGRYLTGDKVVERNVV